MASRGQVGEEGIVFLRSAEKGNSGEIFGGSIMGKWNGEAGM